MADARLCVVEDAVEMPALALRYVAKRGFDHVRDMLRRNVGDRGPDRPEDADRLVERAMAHVEGERALEQQQLRRIGFRLLGKRDGGLGDVRAVFLSRLHRLRLGAHELLYESLDLLELLLGGHRRERRRGRSQQQQCKFSHIHFVSFASIVNNYYDY